MYRPSRPGKIKFMDFTIVRLPDRCVRTARKFYRDGYQLALMQANGNIAITDNGIFERANNPRCQFKVVKCLHGLGLVGDPVLADYRVRNDTYETDLELANLTDQADNLGYRLVKLPKPKTIKRGSVRRLAQNRR